MDWKKVTEQVVTIVIAGLLMAFGSAVVWGVKVILDHERQLIMKDGEIRNLQVELQRTQKRDKELLELVAEEMKQIQEAVNKTCEHKEEPVFPQPQPAPKVNPTAEKFFPEQKTEDYKRILRDKFEQRTMPQQMQMPQ